MCGVTHGQARRVWVGTQEVLDGRTAAEYFAVLSLDWFVSRWYQGEAFLRSALVFEQV